MFKSSDTVDTYYTTLCLKRNSHFLFTHINLHEILIVMLTHNKKSFVFCASDPRVGLKTPSDKMGTFRPSRPGF